MKAYPFAVYDAFSECAFGGSQAAVVTDAATIDYGQRRIIAREIGLPATAFVDEIGADWIRAQFMSTVMELPMCGHGTLGLFTRLLESGCLNLDGAGSVQLRLPQTTAMVSLARREDGRYVVMLDIRPPAFEPPPPNLAALLVLLGLDSGALATGMPAETARGDFIHLVVPLAGLDAMRAIKPDFPGIVRYCKANGIETIAVFCREVENTGNSIHLRDFCPAVGVSESAAAGTTNAALTSYLVRHGLAPTETDSISLSAEQGLELGRPSSVQSRVTLAGKGIGRLQVGGVATRIFDGQFYS